MADNQTDLSRRVRERADADKLAADHSLRTLADQFDAAVAAQPPDVKRWLGCWARLRRAWCEYSGESLL
jgi:hypothetical protein